MKREKFLWILTSDHHESLTVCRGILRAVQVIQGDGNGNALALLPEKIRSFLGGRLHLHFETEERMVRVFGHHAGEKDPDIQRLFSDHQRLRGLLSEGSLEALSVFSGELKDHIRFEETVLFPRLEEMFSREEKEAIAISLEKSLRSVPVLKS